MPVVVGGGERVLAAHHPPDGLPFLAARFLLLEGVVVFEGLRAQHVGDELGRLVVADAEELAHLRRAQKPLQGRLAEVPDDLADVLKDRPGTDARPTAVGEGAEEGLEAPELSGLVNQQHDPGRFRRARLVEHGDGEEEPHQRGPDREILGRDVEEDLRRPARIDQGLERELRLFERGEKHGVVEEAQMGVDLAHDRPELLGRVLLLLKHLRRGAADALGRAFEHRFEVIGPGMAVGLDHIDQPVEAGERHAPEPRDPALDQVLEPFAGAKLEVASVAFPGERDQAFDDELDVGMEVGALGIEDVQGIAAVLRQAAEAHRVPVPGMLAMDGMDVSRDARELGARVEAEHGQAGAVAEDVAQKVAELARARAADSDHRRIAIEAKGLLAMIADLRSAPAEQTGAPQRRFVPPDCGAEAPCLIEGMGHERASNEQGGP